MPFDKALYDIAQSVVFRYHLLDIESEPCEEVEAFLKTNPDRHDAFLDARTVVRRATSENLHRDIGKLKQYQVLATLHPGLEQQLGKLSAQPNPKILYAVPYSLAYADELIRAHLLLNEAADLVQASDEEFARYLRNRSRDLLSNDYESGDASWVTGRFKNLNAQIGSYETYDDGLFGVKSSFAFSLLKTLQKETADLRQAMKGLQALEESLPYKNHKRVREDIPVGVYEVIADFGQARGGNTATILPNESYLARRYGRTILLRARYRACGAAGRRAATGRSGSRPRSQSRRRLSASARRC